MINYYENIDNWCSWFYRFNFAKYLVNKNFTIYGIDNFDDYYSIKFKVLRLKELKKKDNFFFKKS